MGDARRGEGGGNGRLPGRLKGVRKRKRAQRNFECRVVMEKLRLVRVRAQGGRSL